MKQDRQDAYEAAADALFHANELWFSFTDNPLAKSLGGPADARQRTARVAVDAAEKPIRAGELKIAARALLAEAEAYRDKWCRKPNSADWDKGYVAGMESAAHSVANAIDRGRFDFGAEVAP